MIRLEERGGGGAGGGGCFRFAAGAAAVTAGGLIWINDDFLFLAVFRERPCRRGMLPSFWLYTFCFLPKLQIKK